MGTLIVVADSGPLHYLILLEHSDLLRGSSRSEHGNSSISAVPWMRVHRPCAHDDAAARHNPWRSET